MSSNIVNQVAYLRTTRQFPKDPDELIVQLDKAYIDTAAAINTRVIGIHSMNRPSITGESWFLQGNRRQQTLRQIYKFTAAGNILHGINVLGISGFTHCFGTYTDAAGNWYGAIHGSNTAILGQISFYITPNSAGNVLDGNIVILAGAGAPTISSGTLVLEWLAEP